VASVNVSEGVAAPPDKALAQLEWPLQGPTLEILQRRGIGVARRRGSVVRQTLAVADTVGLTLAFILAELIWRVGSRHDEVSAQSEMLLFVATLPFWIAVSGLYGLYKRDEERADNSTVDDLKGVFHLVTVGLWTFTIVASLTGYADPHLAKLVTFWVLAVVVITLGRSVARAVARRNVAYLQNAVVVGAAQVGQLVARKLLQHPEYGINLVGFVDSRPHEAHEEVAHLGLLGTPEQLPEIVSLFDVERVIFAFSQGSDHDVTELVRALNGFDLQIDIVPRFYEVIGPSGGIHMLEGLPLLSLPPLRLSRPALLLKRVIDLIGATTALVVLSPLFLYIAIRIKRETPGPVLYRSERVGKGGWRFFLFKFRTMRPEFCRGDGYGGLEAERQFAALMKDPAVRDEFDKTHKLANDPRVTEVGRFLRRTSLDELPQLLNVLKGDLSLVGPRPVTVEELPLIAKARQAAPTAPVGYWEVGTVQPGLTGYWQINGRSRLDYNDRVRLDQAYIGSWSLGLDLTILAKTIRILLRPSGAF
jgi:exopolysaccharide biosynthesis polyprenyl glycosylphosphotransferase